MPTRLHRPFRENPTTLDRVSAHEWQATIVGPAWALLGGLLCWTWIDPGGGPVTVLSSMSAWIAGGVAVALLVCGIAVTVAVVWPGKDSTAWRIELVALPLGLMAWLSYAIVSPSLFWQVIAYGYVLGAVLRLRVAWLAFHRPQRVLVVVEPKD